MADSKHVTAVTDANFATEVEGHAGVAVVDLWAEWCGPCRMIAPLVEELAAQFNGKIKVTKLDIDANPKTAERYRIRSIPTLLFFKDGKVVDQVIGAVPRATLTDRFSKHAA